MSLRLIRRRVYINDDVNSEMEVAAAAPEAPKPLHILARIGLGHLMPIFPKPKMHSGSSRKFSKLVVRETFNGVTVFSSPRYAAKPESRNSAVFVMLDGCKSGRRRHLLAYLPVAENSAGIIPNALHRRYGTAYAIAPTDDEGKTKRNTASGKATSAMEKHPPRTLDKNRLSHTRCLAVFQSSFPIASATSGAVIVGRKAARKYIVKKH